MEEMILKNINKKDADPIYEKGKIGQIVVLNRVEFSKDDKMREFEQPHLFRILSKEGEGRDTVYEMESLANGEKVKINHRDFSYFYDASEWAHKMRDEKETQKNEASKRIEELKDKITMLADILIRQGNKVVSSYLFGVKKTYSNFFISGEMEFVFMID